MNKQAAPQMIQTLEINDLVSLVRSEHSILPFGGGTKPALSAPWTPGNSGNLTRVDMSAFSGVMEYEPSEFTITAKSGTRLAQLAHTLAEQNQFLPFDPPLIEAGATLGGTIASGLSGSGRLLYGGARDFILGVQFVDGLGEIVRAGGKVVKNAAGFDIPKLMVGSQGGLGILTEITLKVFPRPLGYQTLKIAFDSLDHAISFIQRVLQLPIDLVAIDFAPTGVVWVRVAGDLPTCNKLIARISSLISFGTPTQLNEQEDSSHWTATREFLWCREQQFCGKVPLTTAEIPTLERAIKSLPIERRYSAAGNVLYLAFSDPTVTAQLSDALKKIRLSGLLLWGNHPSMIGLERSVPFAKRIYAAVDPNNRFYRP